MCLNSFFFLRWRVLCAPCLFWTRLSGLCLFVFLFVLVSMILVVCYCFCCLFVLLSSTIYITREVHYFSAEEGDDAEDADVSFLGGVVGDASLFLLLGDDDEDDLAAEGPWLSLSWKPKFLKSSGPIRPLCGKS